ncbi:MAG: sulfotransferase [Woeseia sp.]
MPTSDNVQAELLRAAQLLEDNQPQLAEQHARSILRKSPASNNARRTLGFALLMQERAPEAVQEFEQLFEDSDKSPVRALDLGRALSQAGELARAAETLRTVLGEVPTLTPAWFLLGDVLVEQRDFAGAREAYSAATDNDPFRLQIEQCKRSIQESDLAKAKRIFEHILEQDPNHVEALAGMEVLAMAAENWLEAEHLFTLIRKRTRYWPTLLMGLSQLFLMTSRVPQARDTLATLVEIHPTSLLAWNMLGTANELLMRHTEAIAAFQESLRLEPNQPRACVSIGNIQRIVGDRSASEKTFLDALRFEGMNGECYWGLSNLKTYEFSEQLVSRMTRSLDKDSTSLHNAAPMYFALGKAQEDRGDYAAAFAYYTKGNQIQKRYSAFDAATYKDEIGRIEATFGTELLARAARPSASTDAPIFIVGMPRTGSTLVEQILASHSQVDATMELPFIEQYVRELQVRTDEIGPYPESVPALQTADLERFAERYLESAALYRQQAARFTDKMPNNFVHIGLIHLMFPNAVFIDVVRHPLDTCLSVFKQRFATGQSFSYALDDLGAYYAGYRRLLRHWHNVLPGRIHQLVYENLVSRPEAEIRVLLEFCELPFEQACLSPEKTLRAIRTPSSEQVRLPISAGRIAYWRNFEPHLLSLQQTLGGEIAAFEELLIQA